MKCVSLEKRQVKKVIAISLIVISFLLYAIMPFNACLPFSACMIAGITGSMIAVSEVIFWIGSLMIGREVAKRIRNKVSILNMISHLRERKKGK